MQKVIKHEHIHIRKMDMSDVPFVYHHETKVFHQRIEEKALYQEIIENNLSRYFIALIEGKRVAYIGGWVPKPNAEIMTIFVKDEYRKQHIGHLLLSYMIEELKKDEVESITLEVRPSNTAAITLYRSFGFLDVAVRKEYYQDKEDALLMYLLIGGHR